MLFHKHADLGHHLALNQHQRELERGRVARRALALGGDAVGGCASQDKPVFLVPADFAGRCSVPTDPEVVHPDDPQTQCPVQKNEMDLLRLTKGIPILPHIPSCRRAPTCLKPPPTQHTPIAHDGEGAMEMGSVRPEDTKTPPRPLSKEC